MSLVLSICTKIKIQKKKIVVAKQFAVCQQTAAAPGRRGLFPGVVHTLLLAKPTSTRDVGMTRTGQATGGPGAMQGTCDE